MDASNLHNTIKSALFWQYHDKLTTLVHPASPDSRCMQCLDRALANLEAEIELDLQFRALQAQIARFGSKAEKLFSLLSDIGDLPAIDGWFTTTLVITGIDITPKLSDEQLTIMQRYKNLRDNADFAYSEMECFMRSKEHYINEAAARATDNDEKRAALSESLKTLMNREVASKPDSCIYTLLEWRRELAEIPEVPDYDVNKRLAKCYHEIAFGSSSLEAFTDAIGKLELAMRKKNILKSFL